MDERAVYQRYMRLPMLTREEEQELIRVAKDESEPHSVRKSAQDRVINGHMRMVWKQAGKLRRTYPSISFPDLVSEGSVGLGIAFEKFEPERDLRFSTYATFWMRSMMQEHIYRNVSMVVPDASATGKYLFYKYSFRMMGLSHEFPGLSLEQHHSILAERLVAEGRQPANVDAMKVKVERVAQARSLVLDLDAPVNTDGEDGATFLDYMESNEPSPLDLVEAFDDQALFRRCLAEFKDEMESEGRRREYDILVARRLVEEPVTLDELGERYGVSRERARQLEVKALENFSEKVRAAFDMASAPPALLQKSQERARPVRKLSGASSSFMRAAEEAAADIQPQAAEDSVLRYESGGLRIEVNGAHYTATFEGQPITGIDNKNLAAIAVTMLHGGSSARELLQAVADYGKCRGQLLAPATLSNYRSGVRRALKAIGHDVMLRP